MWSSNRRGCRSTIARCSPNGTLPTGAARMQGPLALVGFRAAIIAWWQTSEAGFLVGGVAIVAAWPWTLIGIKPTNDALLATEPDKAGPQMRALVVKWGALHAVRTGLGAFATIACLCACLSRTP